MKPGNVRFALAIAAAFVAVSMSAPAWSQAAGGDILSREAVLRDPAIPDLGNAQGDVTIVEYFDYQCPYCGEAHPIVEALREQFGDKLRFVFRNFPLTQIHPHAEIAAETAEFAGAHRRFWDMHDMIFENQRRLGPQLLAELAESLDLPLPELEDVFLHHTYKNRIGQDFAGGVRSGKRRRLLRAGDLMHVGDRGLEHVVDSQSKQAGDVSDAVLIERG